MKMDLLDNIRIVLVEPMFGGNLGSVCRAMNNNGITDLAVVNPRADMDMDEARKFSCSAREQLEARREFDSLAEAVADCTVVAATSARTGFYRATAYSPREFAPIALESAKDHRIALVFGREDKGLFNEELALCSHIIQIPSSELYTSLNLSHAVYVCCYEIFAASGLFEPSEETAPEADSELRERMFSMWREMMTETEFVHDQKLDHMMMGLRRIFTRGKLTVPDCKILMGLAKQSIWVAEQWEKEKEASAKSQSTKSRAE
jgi:TrmH family RNA methyltransferase